MTTRPTPPTWTPVRVRLRDLVPWERNPRRMSKAAAERLLRSWRELGQVQTIAIGPDGEVYDGHQRIAALRAVYGEDYEVLALQADRPLTENERGRLVLLLHAGALGEWDWDVLANWDADVLLEGGLDDEMLEALHRDAAALSELLASVGAESEGSSEGSDDALGSPVAGGAGRRRTVCVEVEPEQVEMVVQRLADIGLEPELVDG